MDKMLTLDKAKKMVRQREAVKEQQTQIEDLKAQVNVLNESTNNQATNTILATFETQQ